MLNFNKISIALIIAVYIIGAVPSHITLTRFIASCVLSDNHQQCEKR